MRGPMEFGFFDRAFRGRLIVTGRDRLDLLHRLATSTLLDLEPGAGTQTCFCTPKGRLIDWTAVLNRGDDILLLSANHERLSGHIQQYTITEDVTVRNYMAIEVVVCGPDARRVLDVDLEPWAFGERQLAGVSVQVARIEPLWGDAYSVLAPDAVAVRRQLGETGRRLTETEVDALRVQYGIPAFPNEINEQRNPWEAGLDGAISLKKGCYIGQEVIARLDTYEKVQRRLCRLRCERPAERGARVEVDGKLAAEVSTAAGMEALAFVRSDLARPGTKLPGAEVVAFADYQSGSTQSE